MSAEAAHYKRKLEEALRLATEANEGSRRAIQEAKALAEMLEASEVKLARVRRLVVEHRARMGDGISEPQSALMLGRDVVRVVDSGAVR